MPERRGPAIVRSREGPIDWVKPVAEERVRDWTTSAIGSRDRNLLLGNDFRGRHRLVRPVPEGLAKLNGSFLPRSAIDGVRVRNCNGMLLEDLLLSIKRIVLEDCANRRAMQNAANLVEHHVGPVPGREQHGAMGAVAAPSLV